MDAHHGDVGTDLRKRAIEQSRVFPVFYDGMFDELVTVDEAGDSVELVNLGYHTRNIYPTDEFERMVDSGRLERVPAARR